jgi:hypothetical protein
MRVGWMTDEQSGYLMMCCGMGIVATAFLFRVSRNGFMRRSRRIFVGRLGACCKLG